MLTKVLRIGCLVVIALVGGVFLYIVGHVVIRFTYGASDIFCFTGHRCFTVWQRPGGEAYVIYGEWKKWKRPKDNYLRLRGMRGYADWLITVILSDDGHLIVEHDERLAVECKSSGGYIRSYLDNKSLYDSLYKTRDEYGRRVYKRDVCIIYVDMAGAIFHGGTCVE